MDLESYKQKMAEMGISRGGLGVDAEIEGTPSGSQIKTFRQRSLVNPGASTKAINPPMGDEVPERLKCNDPRTQRAAVWWSSMAPEERKKASLQRAANGRKSWKGKKAATI